MGLKLFIVLLVLIAAGLAYVYLKVLDNPEERFRKKALMGLDSNYGATFPGYYYYLSISDKNGNLKNDLIINPDTLFDGEDNNIGRIIGDPQGKDLREKLNYKLKNKDLFYGIRTPRASSLGHNHLQLFKDSSSGSPEIAVFCEHPNGMFLIKNESESVRCEQVVISDFNLVLIEAGGYYFEFERLDVSDSRNESLLKGYIERHSKKSAGSNTPKKKKNNPYATRPNDGSEPATRSNDRGTTTSGGGRKIRR